MNEVRLPYDYIPTPTAGRPIASGYIYIGTSGTDPTVVANQISVSARQEDGTSVAISQPIRTNAGGNPEFNGSPITILVSANEFSITVQNSNGEQVYTQSNATTSITATGVGDADLTTSTGTQTLSEAIDTRLFVGASAPSFTVPYMKWADTTSGLLRIRNAADDAWINLFSLSTGIADYLSNGNYYTDSGAADAYVLSTVSTMPAPSAYSDGMVILFVPANSNTGASTINVAGLGVKTLAEINGDTLLEGRVVAGEEVVATYFSGADEFRVLPQLNRVTEARLKAGRKNYLINGGFDIWQRETSFANPNDVYTADRWKSDVSAGGAGAGTVTRETFTVGQTDVPGNPTYYMRHDQTVAKGSLAPPFVQRIEGVKTLSGRTAIISFSAKANAAKTFDVRALQVFGTGGSPSGTVSTVAGSVSVSTSWQRFEIPVQLPSISGKILGTNGDDYLQIDLPEQAATIFTLDVANFQIEEGQFATDFEYRPIAEELALCQRYYQQFYGHGCILSATSVASLYAQFQTQMRDTPTVVLVGTPQIEEIGTANRNITSLSTSAINRDNARQSVNLSTSGTAFRPVVSAPFFSTANGIFLDAEL